MRVISNTRCTVSAPLTSANRRPDSRARMSASTTEPQPAGVHELEAAQVEDDRRELRLFGEAVELGLQQWPAPDRSSSPVGAITATVPLSVVSNSSVGTGAEA